MKKVTLEQVQQLVNAIRKELPSPIIRIIEPPPDDRETPENEQFVVFLNDLDGQQEKKYLSCLQNAQYYYIMTDENGLWSVIKPEHYEGSFYGKNGEPGEPPCTSYEQIGDSFEHFEACLTECIVIYIRDCMKEAIMLYELSDFIN